MGSLGMTEAEDSMAVIVLSKEMVKPAVPSTAGDLYLPCLDILWERMHYNQRLMFYRTSMENVSQAMETLKQSLSEVLVHYYPWCGRLARRPVQKLQKQQVDEQQQKQSNGDGDTENEITRLFIECNDAGVEFVEASVDLEMGELEKHGFQMMPLYEQLCQHIDPHGGENRYKVPLLSVQVTRFTDGGLSLGISQSHVVADGQSLWNFMVSWGEIARGVGISMEPVIDRFKMSEEPSEEIAKGFSLDVFKLHIDDDDGGGRKNTIDEGNGDVKRDGSTQSNGRCIDQRSEVSSSGIEDDVVVTKNTSTGNDTINGDAPNPEKENALAKPKIRLTQFLFKMVGETIKKLKEEAGGKFSTYEVICAHMWKKVTSARLDTQPKPASLSPKKTPASFLVLINFRSRMVPPLPPSYFGNAIMFSVLHGLASDVREEPLGRTAQRLHEGITKDSQYHWIRSFMHWMELRNNSFPRPEYTPGTIRMNVASSPRFPVYQVDFGWGAPLAVRSAKVPGDGELVLFGGNPNCAPGDVEICMALPRHVLDRLLEDPMFLGTYTSPPFTF